MTDHREHFIDAITNAAAITDDQEFAQDSAKIYGDVQDELDVLLDPEDRPTLAFLAFVPVGHRNRQALTALLQDRLVVVWGSGIFRRKFGSLVVPYSTITAVDAQAASSDPTLGGNPAVTIKGEQTTTLAIPPRGSVLAAAVRDAIVAQAGLSSA